MILARGAERPPTSSPAGWDSSPCPWGCQLCVMNNLKTVLESTRELICRLLSSSGHISLTRNIMSKLWIWFAMTNAHRPAVLRDGFPRHVHGEVNFASWITFKTVSALGDLDCTLLLISGHNLTYEKYYVQIMKLVRYDQCSPTSSPVLANYA